MDWIVTHFQEMKQRQDFMSLDKGLLVEVLERACHWLRSPPLKTLGIGVFGTPSLGAAKGNSLSSFNWNERGETGGSLFPSVVPPSPSLLTVSEGEQGYSSFSSRTAESPPGSPRESDSEDQGEADVTENQLKRGEEPNEGGSYTSPKEKDT